MDISTQNLDRCTHDSSGFASSLDTEECIKDLHIQGETGDTHDDPKDKYLRKHAYSNILKNFTIKKWKFFS